MSAVTFSDEADLSSWAAEAVKRAYLIQVMNGTGGNSMSPKMTVTITGGEGGAVPGARDQLDFVGPEDIGVTGVGAGVVSMTSLL